MQKTNTSCVIIIVNNLSKPYSNSTRKYLTNLLKFLPLLVLKKYCKTSPTTIVAENS